ncbi:hypothetical protein [Roseomonas sp. USHLN139]|uniref:hypothetical protein n=1 Tax=Roseomonas sp. USHLN139 TaxID=3081298 RepID=UPI003B02631B
MPPETPRPNFPPGSLLAALLGPQAPVELRRAAQRLRAEAAPAVAVEAEIAALAAGLGGSEVARAPAVLDALPPLFWVEARQAARLLGWMIEKRRGGLSARGFGIADGADALPEAAETIPLPFGTAAVEDTATLFLRGLVAAVALPEMLAQMGEASPVLLLPAEPRQAERPLLRGLRLSVAMSPDQLPQ